MPSFSKDITVYLFTRIVLFSISIASNSIIAHILGPEGKGILAFYIIVPSTATLLLSFDFGTGNIYFIGRRKYPVVNLVSNSIFIAINMGVIISAFLIPLVPSLSRKFLNDNPPTAFYLAVTIPVLMMLADFLVNILLGLRKIIQIGVIQTSSRIFYVVSLFLLLYIFNLGVLGAVLAYIFMLLMNVLINIFWIRTNGYKISLRPQFYIILDLFKYSIKSYFGSITQNTNYRLDIFLVAYFLDSSDIGLYTVSILLAEITLYVPDSIGYILFAQTSANDTKAADSFTPIVTRIALLATMLIALIAFLTAKWIVPFLFGPAFIKSILPMQFLLPGIVALGLWKIICHDLAGRGLPQYKSYSAGISLFVTLLLDIILIPNFGIIGAAIGSSIGCIVGTVFVIFYFNKVSKAGVLNMLVPILSDLRYLNWRRIFKRYNS